MSSSQFHPQPHQMQQQQHLHHLDPQQQQQVSYQPQLYQQQQSEARTADLWLKIDQYHLNYLKAEDGIKKLEIQKKLDGKTELRALYRFLMFDWHFEFNFTLRDVT